jgi:hypothetical protein
MAPTLAISCAALPSQGAVSPWGGPGARRATTLVASRTALLPEGAAFCKARRPLSDKANFAAHAGVKSGLLRFNVPTLFTAYARLPKFRFRGE